MNADTSQLRHGYAQIEDGIKLHYVQQGDGPLALLLHGFPEFWYSWRHQIPFLAGKFKAVAPDLRGYNLSDKPRGVASYFVEKLTDDVRSLIRVLGAEKAIVVGHDWGGIIAWYLAAYHPEAVERLVVLNAPHPRAYLREMPRNFRQLRASWYVFMFQLPWLPEWYVRRERYLMLRKALRGWAHRKEAFSDEDLRLFEEAMSQPGCLTAAINYYRGLFRDRATLKRIRQFPTIAVPTLIIWAEDDRALTKDLTYGLDPYFAEPPRIRYIPRCSHWVQQEQPDQVNRYLEEFLF
ncbi:MAG: alpha/beta hydrolase [bacterium]